MYLLILSACISQIEYLNLAEQLAHYIDVDMISNLIFIWIFDRISTLFIYTKPVTNICSMSFYLEIF